MASESFEDLFEAGLALAALLVFAVFIISTDLSVQGGNEPLGRFIYAMMSIIAPTSAFDVAVSVTVALIGGITVARQNAKAGIIVAAGLYGLISFIIAWATAPV